MFSASKSLICFVCWFILDFWIPHTSEIIWHLSFSVWLILLNKVPSRSMHVVAGGNGSFFFHGWVIFHGIHAPLLYPFIYWCTLRCFHILAIQIMLQWTHGCMCLFKWIFLGPVDPPGLHTDPHCSWNNTGEKIYLWISMSLQLSWVLDARAFCPGWLPGLLIITKAPTTKEPWLHQRKVFIRG